MIKNQMKKLIILCSLCIFGIMFSQKNKAENTLKEKHESRQAQDLSVPPPPITDFPAQFSGGNRLFLENVRKNLSESDFKSSDKILKTKIILKIDQKGNVLNISTYGSNSAFNGEVKKSAEKVTKNTIWEPAKNKMGITLIDIVNLPFEFKNK